VNWSTHEKSSVAYGTLLIDTSPDLREQLITYGIEHIDAALITHTHADHTHGIDDLRFMAQTSQKRIPVYSDASNIEDIHFRFRYCFETAPGSGYPPILTSHIFQPNTPFSISGKFGDVFVTPVWVHHGIIRAYGFRIGDLAYIPDVSAVPAESEALLQGLDVLIIDALRYKPHVSHFCVDDALAFIAKLNPKKAILTHMNIDIDYATLANSLPDFVIPAYDGLEVSAETFLPSVEE
jgi:phosphoribosyl 1,2-cyclic phosphate phosphodiesterase